MTPGIRDVFSLTFSSLALLSNSTAISTVPRAGDGFRPGLPYPEDKALWEASLTLERSPVRFITSGGPGPDLLCLRVTEVVLNCVASVNSLENKLLWSSPL